MKELQQFIRKYEKESPQKFKKATPEKNILTKSHTPMNLQQDSERVSPIRERMASSPTNIMIDEADVVIPTCLSPSRANGLPDFINAQNDRKINIQYRNILKQFEMARDKITAHTIHVRLKQYLH